MPHEFLKQIKGVEARRPVLDFDAAARLGTRVIWALSLPGKVAPVTAGRSIKNTIYNILHELGV